MNRRCFLQASAAAVALAQTTPPKKAKITSSVMLWTLNGSFEDRVRTAANAGMQSVELVGEYATWSDDELVKNRKFVRSFGMGIDTIIATPDWVKRPVWMVNPAHREAFLSDVKRAIEVAQKLECPQIILMSGNAIPGRTYEEQYASLVEGAKRATEMAAEAKLTLIFEPLNSKVNHKGYFLTTCTEGLRLVKDVDSPHLKLLFDLYHEQVQTGEVMKTAVEAAPHVAVYHVADAPGRHDPGSGEMKYAEIYKAIAKTGYAGYICMEYLPVGDSVKSLIASVDEMRANVGATTPAAK